MYYTRDVFDLYYPGYYDTWPSLKYLRSDYQSVRIVAHVRIREAEIVNRIPGYDNWKIVAEVIEPFKGKFRKGEVIEYFHGAEAPSKKEFFTGEKLDNAAQIHHGNLVGKGLNQP